MPGLDQGTFAITDADDRVLGSVGATAPASGDRFGGQRTRFGLDRGMHAIADRRAPPCLQESDPSAGTKLPVFRHHRPARRG